MSAAKMSLAYDHLRWVESRIVRDMSANDLDFARSKKLSTHIRLMHSSLINLDCPSMNLKLQLRKLHNESSLI